MPEPRGESFYGGRFFENTEDRNAESNFWDLPSPEEDKFSESTPRTGWRYEAAFRGSPSADEHERPYAYVSSRYLPDRYEAYDHADHDRNFDVADIRTGQKGLFYAEPERHEIDMAFASKSARHHIPTLLGMTAQNSLNLRGQVPRATNDLSEHSSKLVKKFSDLGVVQPSRKDFPLNSITWDRGDALNAKWQAQEVQESGKEVPFDRVDKSRQFTRGLLRRNRPTQGEQLTIT
jgi:hypothetical protein